MHQRTVCSQAAASRYGVADLELLAKETHKFESRYLDNLVGLYPQVRRPATPTPPRHPAPRPFPLPFPPPPARMAAPGADSSPPFQALPRSEHALR